jgi:HAT1-interacting factor 1
MMTASSTKDRDQSVEDEDVVGKSSMSTEERAKRLLAEGKYEESVALYAQLLEEVTAREADQLAEPLGLLYLSYGKALLQLAISRQTLGLVNEAAIEQSLFDEADDDEQNKGDGDDDGQDDINDEDDDEPKQVLEFSSDVEDEEQHDGEGEEVDESVDDFGLAFEILDLARLVFSKHADGDEHRALMEAEARQEIGDLYMETEEFVEAVKEYREALRILKAGTTSYREQASLQFKLGIALEFAAGAAGAAPDAVDAFEQAKQLLEEHLDSAEVDRDERAEVVDLLKEVEAKIAELAGGVGQPVVSLQQFLREAAESANQAIASQVQDVSSLIKKRRVQVESTEDVDDRKSSKTVDQ